MTTLSPADKLVYGLLITLGSKSEYIWAKNDFIAETLGLSLYQVKNSLKRLLDNNYIKIVNSNRYRQIVVNQVIPVIEKPDNESNSANIDILLEKIYNKLWQLNSFVFT